MTSLGITWSADRPRPGARQLGHVLLTITVSPEDDSYVGVCQELGTSSFGTTIDEALKATLEATSAYLEALEDSGERERVFKERGVAFYEKEPPSDFETVNVIAHPGQVISAQRLSELVDA
jgi:predicted RNase H-like HicB family nuclease